MKAKCVFCGAEIEVSKQLSFPGENRKYTCGKCTEHCNKVCPLGKSGSVQGWHFEPCLFCKSNPYKIYNAETV